VAGTVSLSADGKGATLSFAPPLQANTRYYARVAGGPGGVTDTAGNAMLLDHTWDWLTGDSPPPAATPPTVLASGPDGDAVPVASAVTAEFSEAVGRALFATACVTRAPAADCVPRDEAQRVQAAVSVSADGRTVSVDPAADLQPDTPYFVLVLGAPGGVADAEGNELAADFSWSFRTATATAAAAP
jgi:hypothetical protein